jgi:predicted DsbA family dithiol-disulfide isomerase
MAERVRREFDADVEWLPFDLHPEYPLEGIALAELHARYGIATGADDPLHGSFAEAGLVYNRPDVVPNTRLALRLTELARDEGLHEPFHDRLMDAYWSQATDIGDPDELRRLADEVGLARAEVDRVIADGDAYLQRVAASTHQAQSVGINAIPAFVLDQRLIVLGAHAIETFRSAFAQLTADAT